MNAAAVSTQRPSSHGTDTLNRQTSCDRHVADEMTCLTGQSTASEIIQVRQLNLDNRAPTRPSLHRRHQVKPDMQASRGGLRGVPTRRAQTTPAPRGGGVSVAAISHLFRAGPRRALPRTCRPVQDETTGSYLLRLAAANRITGADLVDYLTAGASQSIDKVSLQALVTASGQPPLALAYALPQLRPQHPDHSAMALHARTLPAKPNTVRPACRRCAAVHTAAERIDVWYRHEHNICLRHPLWTGPGVDNPRDQVNLAAHPDIVNAQARHLRLIRRHGRGVVHTAYRTARLIWETLTNRGWGLPHAIVRDIPLPAGFGHQNWPADARDPVHAAATYPEVITLTQMLVAPHWRPFAMSASTADHDRFRAEFQRRLPPAHRDLANTNLQTLATVRHAPVGHWHQPAAEVAGER